MNVTRASETTLVVKESTVWLAAFFLLIVAGLIYAAVHSGDYRLLTPGAVFALFGIICNRSITFTFDRTESMVRWRRMRFLKISTGSIVFSDIKGVGFQTSLSTQGQLGRTTYRIVLYTNNGDIPLTDSYGTVREWYEQGQEKIEGFLKGK